MPQQSSRFLLGAVAFAGWLGFSFPAEANPRGLLIYADPANYPQVCEYSSLKTGPVYATVRRADGHDFQVMSNARMLWVEYPSANPQLNGQAAAEWNLAVLQNLRREFPRYEARLAAIESQWKNALAFAKQAGQSGLLVATTGPAKNDRYPAMPRDAFASLAAEKSPSTPLKSPPPQDPFAHFGGTALDARRGFLGTPGAHHRAPIGSAFRPPSEPGDTTDASGFSEHEPAPDAAAPSENNLAALQATLQKRLAD